MSDLLHLLQSLLGAEDLTQLLPGTRGGASAVENEDSLPRVSS